VRFDWAFVARSLQRAGYPVPDATRLCTMRLSQAVDPLATSHRLVDVTARQGVVITQAHDALADADAAAAVLTGLLAVAGVDDVADLPAIRGSATTWPTGPPLPRWKRWIRRATGRRPQARPASPPPS
jgi:DNA polymerase-3 subunit epsilon